MNDPRTFEYNEEQRTKIICEESLFDQEGFQTIEISDDLHFLTKQRVKAHLHAITLSDYIRQGIIPKGLRLQKEPMLSKKTEDFCDRWCAILNKCSIDLMTLLVEEHKKAQDDLDKKIEEHKQMLSETIKNKENLEEILKQTQELQESLTKEIKEEKIKKFNKDKKDSMEGNIYNWRNPKWIDRPRTRYTRTRFDAGQSQQLNRFSSSDQLSSASSSGFLGKHQRGGASAPGHLNKKKQNKKRTNQHAEAEREAMQYERTRARTFQMRK